MPEIEGQLDLFTGEVVPPERPVVERAQPDGVPRYTRVKQVGVPYCDACIAERQANGWHHAPNKAAYRRDGYGRTFWYCILHVNEARSADHLDAL